MKLKRVNKYLQNLLKEHDEEEQLKGGAPDDEIPTIIASAIASIVGGTDNDDDDDFLKKLKAKIEDLNKYAFSYNIPTLIESVNKFTEIWKNYIDNNNNDNGMNSMNECKPDNIYLKTDNYDITIKTETNIDKPKMKNPI